MALHCFPSLVLVCPRPCCVPYTQVAAALCASYIGGSINFAATAHALELTQRGLLAACMAADNLAMGLYLAAIMAIPAHEDAAAAPSADSAGSTAGDALR